MKVYCHRRLLVSLSLMSCASVQAFELGEARIVTNETHFSAQITIKDLRNDGYSRMTGEVKSFSPFSDALEYAVQAADNGDGIALVLTHPDRLTEALTIDVSLMYRGESVERQYTLNPGLPALDMDGDETRAEVSTITTESGVIDEIETLRVQNFDLSLTHTTHTVEPGQSLFEIAIACRELGGTDFQRAIAIYAANKATFADGDINQISVGTELNIPQRSYIDLFTADEARSMFFKVVTGELELLVDNPLGELDADTSPLPPTPIDDSVKSTEKRDSLAEYSHLRQWLTELKEEGEVLRAQQAAPNTVDDNQTTTDTEISELQSQISRLEITKADLAEKLNLVEEIQALLKQRSDEMTHWVKTERVQDEKPTIVFPVNK